MYRLDTNLQTQMQHARALFGPDRTQPATQDLINQTMEAGRNIKSFAKTIALVDAYFGKVNAQPEAQIINFLIGKKGEPSCWRIKKGLFRDLSDEAITEQLIRGIFIEAIHSKDDGILDEIYERAKRTNHLNERVTTLYIRSLFKCDLAHKAYQFVTRQTKASRDLESIHFIAYYFLANLPVSEELMAKKVYQSVTRKCGEAEKLVAVYSRFIPIEKQSKYFMENCKKQLGSVELVNRLLSSFVKQEQFDRARKLFLKAQARTMIDPVSWNIIIDMEFRLVGDTQSAHEFFLESPFELILKDYDGIAALDLHEYSLGTNALRVHSFLKAFSSEPCLILITGIGSEEEGNYLRMQTYIAAFVQEHFKNRFVIEKDPKNQGILRLTPAG